jgi:hypothetical protein
MAEPIILEEEVKTPEELIERYGNPEMLQSQYQSCMSQIRSLNSSGNELRDKIRAGEHVELSSIRYIEEMIEHRAAAAKDYKRMYEEIMQARSDSV